MFFFFRFFAQHRNSIRPRPLECVAHSKPTHCALRTGGSDTHTHTHAFYIEIKCSSVARTQIVHITLGKIEFNRRCAHAQVRPHRSVQTAEKKTHVSAAHDARAFKHKSTHPWCMEKIHDSEDERRIIAAVCTKRHDLKHTHQRHLVVKYTRTHTLNHTHR